MKREISFRGIDVETGEWRYGSLVLANGGKLAFISHINPKPEDTWAFSHEVKLETVGQYTGLKDKNGLKIYEGDIASHIKFCPAPSDYHTGEPAWDEMEYKRKGVIGITPSKGVVLRGNVEDWDYNDDKLLQTRRQYGNPGGWEVYSNIIGNLHDNPELLKQEAL